MTRQIPFGESLMLHMQINNAIENYLQWKSVYSPSAAKTYAIRLKYFVHTLAENITIDQITLASIISFHKKMETENYSRVTISYSLVVLKNFFSFWKDRGYTVVNPKDIKPVKYLHRIKPVATKDDFDKLSASLDEYNYTELQIKLAIHLLWDTGMRLSELTDLNISDINDPNEDGIRTAQIMSKKSYKHNLVAWSKETDKLLCMYLGVRLSNNQHAEALFINNHAKKKKRLNARSVQRWIKIACYKAGITKLLTPHSFRHGKAHQMLNNGANIRDVQAVLRHVNPVTTFHYLSMNEKQFLEVAGKHLKFVM